MKARSRIEECEPWDGGDCHAKCSWKSLGKRINSQICVPKTNGWNLEPEWKQEPSVDSQSPR